MLGSALLLFLIFCLFHSLGAQEKCKDLLARLFTRFFVDHFWRFIYCVISWVLLYSVWVPAENNLGPAFQHPFFIYPAWLFGLSLGLKTLGFVIMYWAFLQFDYLSFIGLKQLLNGMAILCGAKPRFKTDIAGVGHLEIKGIYRYIRHPMLTGGLLTITPPWASLDLLLTFCLVLAYSVIGGYFEERRLIKNFGEQYVSYKREVGGFLPRMRRAAISP